MFEIPVEILLFRAASIGLVLATLADAFTTYRALSRNPRAREANDLSSWMMAAFQKIPGMSLKAAVAFTTVLWNAVFIAILSLPLWKITGGGERTVSWYALGGLWLFWTVTQGRAAVHNWKVSKRR